ncbi:MAG: filamentous hemagglutinin N-terminal domain-containing protein [Scytonematopsis contorta HA4267-MV1]|nr:filamentous hemagglutinin N-terminal domain-containing protein [Scytonematopsis contorta HA4267-MV1]
MNQSSTKKFYLKLLSSIAVSNLIYAYTYPTIAQITPDTTLPINTTIRVDNNTSIIEAGTRVQGNLFHSLREFSVINSREAFFNNPLNIRNIITRVTGQSPSDINGRIRANGSANLFLINPNGIIFGKNAQLNIGGSFIGSTANAIGFGNNGTFSATNPEAPTALLTINPSTFLFNQINQIGIAKIESNSIASAGRNPSNAFDIKGLRVVDGKSLLLVGGDININNGGLYAFGGRVELGSVAEIGTIDLNIDSDNYSLNFPSGVNRGDISFSNASKVNVRAGNGGSIAIHARNLQMTNRSQILAGIEKGLGSEKSVGGNIDINTTGKINLQQASEILNNMQEFALGKGGDVNIKTDTLRLTEGSRISAITYGAGQGGNLIVNATSSVELIGNRVDNWEFFSGLFAEQVTQGSAGKGNAGNITINTPLLRVLDGAYVSASTFGAGRAGDLNIDTGNGRIEIIGVANSAPAVSASSITAQTYQTATGNAGHLTINTGELIAQDGGQVRGATFGAGQGGNLTINATSSVKLIRTNPIDGFVNTGLYVTQSRNGPAGTGDAGNLSVNTPLLQILDLAAISAGSRGPGRGGNINITTDQLLVRNSQIRARSLWTGTGGNITINAKNSINLEDNALITTNTRSNGANQATINITSADLILRRSSNITTNANVSADLVLRRGNDINTNVNASNVIGGNININTGNLALLENSNITANSTDARGGKINIQTQGLFNTQDSAITARGATQALSGTVNINSTLNPNSLLKEIPINLVDPSRQIVSSCVPGTAQNSNSFIVTGRGGIPANSTEVLQDTSTIAAWVIFDKKIVKICGQQGNK